MKPVKGWVVVDPSGMVILHTFRINEDDSIKNYLSDGSTKWEYFYNRGYRCIRVELKEI